MDEKVTSIFSKDENEKLETPESLAEFARNQLETLIKSGIRSVVFIAEREDGFDFCSAPNSVFIVLGAVKSVYDVFNDKGN